jgi:hypothetical protein
MTKNMFLVPSKADASATRPKPPREAIIASGHHGERLQKAAKSTGCWTISMWTWPPNGASGRDLGSDDTPDC